MFVSGFVFVVVCVCLPGIPTGVCLMTRARMSHCCVSAYWIAAVLAPHAGPSAVDTHTWLSVCGSVWVCVTVQYVCVCVYAHFTFQFHFSFVVLSSPLSHSDWSSAQRLLLSVCWGVKACPSLSCFCLCHLCCWKTGFVVDMKGWDCHYLCHTHARTHIYYTHTHNDWLGHAAQLLLLCLCLWLSHLHEVNECVCSAKWIKNAASEGCVGVCTCMYADKPIAHILYAWNNVVKEISLVYHLHSQAGRKQKETLLSEGEGNWGNRPVYPLTSFSPSNIRLVAG